MRKILLVFCTIVGLFGMSSTLKAAESKKKSEKIQPLPFFSHLGAKSSNSALSMECHGKPGATEIKCDFILVNILKKSASEVQEERMAFLKNIHENLETEFKNHQKTCAEARAKKPDTSDWPGEKVVYLRRSDQGMNALCSCTDKTCFESKAPQLFKTNDRDCTIHTYRYTLDFKKASKRQWISNPGPSGMCDLATVASIEYDKENENLWTYTQVRITGNTDQPLCQGFELNKPVEYSWKYPTEAVLDCETVRIGAP